MTNCGKITSEHRNKCEEFISQDEIIATIGKLSKHKSPGRDGLYQNFGGESSPVLEWLCNDIALRNIDMSKSMREGMITLIYKGKGNWDKIKN